MTTEGVVLVGTDDTFIVLDWMIPHSIPEYLEHALEIRKKKKNQQSFPVTSAIVKVQNELQKEIFRRKFERPESWSSSRQTYPAQ